jgi:hypothetical protein
MFNQNKDCMKRISFILMSLALAVSGVFTSCTKEDDPDGPIIAFSNNQTETTLAKGVTSWEINANITSLAGLEEVKVFQVTSGGEDQIGTAITDFPDKNDYDLKVNISGIMEQTTIKVSVTDKNNVTNSKNFVIKVTANDPIPATDKLVFYTGSLAAQLGAQTSDFGSSYATSTGSVYKSAAAKTNAGKVDFIYYYSATASIAAEIISPKYAADNGGVVSANTWTVKNETQFKKVDVTATQFNAIVATDEALVTSKATGFTEQRVTALAANDVFAFKTAAGKLGLAKVVSISGTTAGNITIEVKVQK